MINISSTDSSSLKHNALWLLPAHRPQSSIAPDIRRKADAVSSPEATPWTSAATGKSAAVGKDWPWSEAQTDIEEKLQKSTLALPIHGQPAVPIHLDQLVLNVKFIPEALRY